MTEIKQSSRLNSSVRLKQTDSGSNRRKWTSQTKPGAGTRGHAASGYLKSSFDDDDDDDGKNPDNFTAEASGLHERRD